MLMDTNIQSEYNNMNRQTDSDHITYETTTKVSTEIESRQSESVNKT